MVKKGQMINITLILIAVAIVFYSFGSNTTGQFLWFDDSEPETTTTEDPYDSPMPENDGYCDFQIIPNQDYEDYNFDLDFNVAIKEFVAKFKECHCSYSYTFSGIADWQVPGSEADSGHREGGFACKHSDGSTTSYATDSGNYPASCSYSKTWSAGYIQYDTEADWQAMCKLMCERKGEEPLKNTIDLAQCQEDAAKNCPEGSTVVPDPFKDEHVETEIMFGAKSYTRDDLGKNDK